MRRRQLTKDEKTQVIAKTDGCCHICGRKIATGARTGRFVIDHVVPIELGGRDEPSNMLLACRSCNGLRWNHHPETIRRILFLAVVANLKGYKNASMSADSKAVRLMRARRLVENFERRDRLSAPERERLLRWFVKFEDLVAERMQKRLGGKKGRWSERMTEALAKTDRAIPPRHKLAYRRLVPYEKPGPEERKTEERG